MKSPATPAKGTPAARVAATGGRVCEWVNTSSGEVIDVSVARYDDATTATLRAQAATGTPVAAWGSDAWFSSADGAGTATAIAGGYWIVARSTVFASADDASTFVTGPLAALR